MVEIYSAGERAQRLRDGGMEVLTSLMDQGRLHLADPEALSRATAEAIVGGTFHQVRGALERDDFDPEELLPQLMYSVVQPYPQARRGGADGELAMTHARFGT